jgi:hypothetical protein
VGVLYLRGILMILMALRLLLPPGICVCKWNAPAARLLVALLDNDRQVPSEEEREDDDHAPGCPASPLAVGMGIQPPSVTPFPPDLSFDVPPLDTAPSFASAPFDTIAADDSQSPPDPLYLTLRALLL